MGVRIPIFQMRRLRSGGQGGKGASHSYRENEHKSGDLTSKLQSFGCFDWITLSSVTLGKPTHQIYRERHVCMSTFGSFSAPRLVRDASPVSVYSAVNLAWGWGQKSGLSSPQILNCLLPPWCLLQFIYSSKICRPGSLSLSFVPLQSATILCNGAFWFSMPLSSNMLT